MTNNIYLTVIAFLFFTMVCLMLILMIVGIIILIYDIVTEWVDWFNFYREKQK